MGRVIQKCFEKGGGAAPFGPYPRSAYAIHVTVMVSSNTFINKSKLL